MKESEYLKMMDNLTEEGIQAIKKVLEHYKNYPRHLKGLSEKQIEVLTGAYEILIDLNNEIFDNMF